MKHSTPSFVFLALLIAPALVQVLVSPQEGAKKSFEVVSRAQASPDRPQSREATPSEGTDAREKRLNPPDAKDGGPTLRLQRRDEPQKPER